jgi:hypothetical protein
MLRPEVLLVAVIVWARVCARIRRSAHSFFLEAPAETSRPGPGVDFKAAGLVELK